MGFINGKMFFFNQTGWICVLFKIQIQSRYQTSFKHHHEKQINLIERKITEMDKNKSARAHKI